MKEIKEEIEMEAEISRMRQLLEIIAHSNLDKHNYNAIVTPIRSVILELRNQIKDLNT